MEAIVRTVYGSYLQTCRLLGLPFTPAQHSTLNEKFNIQANTGLTVNDVPKMNYFSIGNGGHRYITGADGIAVPEPIQHRATDAALFNHLPFVLREPSLDLTPAQRTNYGLRRQETHQGQTYIAYYLKRFDVSAVQAMMEYRIVNNGVITINPFTPNTSNLNPTPPALNNSGVNVVSGDYVSASSKITLGLNAEDVSELLHVAEVIYDNDAYAIISEIGLCTGVDRIVQGTGISGTFNYTEAIGVQITSFFAIHSALKYTLNGLDILLEVGSSEPLLKLI